MARRAAVKLRSVPGTGTHLQSNIRGASRRKPIGMQMQHDRDPAEELFEKIGDLSGVHVLNNQVLYAIYERPKITKGGVHLTDTTTSEDEYQGKAGLILKVGPIANLANDTRGVEFKPGIWIAVRPSDGWAIKLNGTLCRLINESMIHMVIPTPDAIW